VVGTPRVKEQSAIRLTVTNALNHVTIYEYDERYRLIAIVERPVPKIDRAAGAASGAEK
jgi:hypothetical protein